MRLIDRERVSAVTRATASHALTARRRLAQRGRGRGRGRACLATVAAALGALAAPALGEIHQVHKPDSTRNDASGPLFAGDIWNGTGFLNIDDRDVFDLWVGPGQTAVTIKLTNTSRAPTGDDPNEGGGITFLLSDNKHNQLDRDHDSYGGVMPGQSDQAGAALNGPGRFFFTAGFFSDLGYSFGAPPNTTYTISIQASKPLLTRPCGRAEVNLAKARLTARRHPSAHARKRTHRAAATERGVCHSG